MEKQTKIKIAKCAAFGAVTAATLGLGIAGFAVGNILISITSVLSVTASAIFAGVTALNIRSLINPHKAERRKLDKKEHKRKFKEAKKEHKLVKENIKEEVKTYYPEKKDIVKRFIQTQKAYREKDEFGKRAPGALSKTEKPYKVAQGLAITAATICGALALFGFGTTYDKTHAAEALAFESNTPVEEHIDSKAVSENAVGGAVGVVAAGAFITGAVLAGKKAKKREEEMIEHYEIY